MEVYHYRSIEAALLELSEGAFRLPSKRSSTTPSKAISACIGPATGQHGKGCFEIIFVACTVVWICFLKALRRMTSFNR